MTESVWPTRVHANMRSALILNPLPRTSSKGEEDKWKEEASKSACHLVAEASKERGFAFCGCSTAVRQAETSYSSKELASQQPFVQASEEIANTHATFICQRLPLRIRSKSSNAIKHESRDPSARPYRKWRQLRSWRHPGRGGPARDSTGAPISDGLPAGSRKLGTAARRWQRQGLDPHGAPLHCTAPPRRLTNIERGVALQTAPGEKRGPNGIRTGSLSAHAGCDSSTVGSLREGRSSLDPRATPPRKTPTSQLRTWQRTGGGGPAEVRMRPHRPNAAESGDGCAAGKVAALAEERSNWETRAALAGPSPYGCSIM
ncbi:unnamed protein product [Prorocentrum cordatum]|uniref:Uncharacterized protein n=1 Tax=Prorocentrum cordatum TaxID=2364126 RepID=A0ABN9SFR9_9DINO|nr:unnamed protein product [Polarella glacialis]